MSTSLVLADQDLAIVRAVLRAHLPKDAAVWVFGSRARGTTKRAADLDLAVDVGRALTRQEAGALADAFEESDLSYSVDVADLRSVSAAFRAIIEPGKVRLSI